MRAVVNLLYVRTVINLLCVLLKLIFCACVCACVRAVSNLVCVRVDEINLLYVRTCCCN